MLSNLWSQNTNLAAAVTKSDIIIVVSVSTILQHNFRWQISNHI